MPQDISDGEVKSYAQAVRGKSRAGSSSSLDKIKEMLGTGNTDSIVCHSPESLTRFRQRPECRGRFRKLYKDIVESHRLHDYRLMRLL